MSITKTLKLNANHLKFIAIIAMTLDHIADLLYPGFPNIISSNILHIIGRLTAPIMFFLYVKDSITQEVLRNISHDCLSLHLYHTLHIALHLVLTIYRLLREKYLIKQVLCGRWHGRLSHFMLCMVKFN